MRKLLILGALLLLSMSVSAKTSKLIDCEGKWVSAIPMTKMDADSVDVTYTFTKDSLYIDVFPSGCPLAQMSIKKTGGNKKYFKCNAVETIHDIISPIVINKIHHLEFKKDKFRGKSVLLVYRENEMIDIIKRFP